MFRSLAPILRNIHRAISATLAQRQQSAAPVMQGPVDVALRMPRIQIQQPSFGGVGQPFGGMGAWGGAASLEGRFDPIERLLDAEMGGGGASMSFTPIPPMPMYTPGMGGSTWGWENFNPIGAALSEIAEGRGPWDTGARTGGAFGRLIGNTMRRFWSGYNRMPQAGGLVMLPTGEVNPMSYFMNPGQTQSIIPADRSRFNPVTGGYIRIPMSGAPGGFVTGYWGPPRRLSLKWIR